MVDREKLREILRRADAVRVVVPPAQDDTRERRRAVLERAGLVEPSQPKTERPPESQAVEAVPAPQAPVPSSQDVVQAPASDWSPILTAEEIKALRDALGWPSTEGPEELGEEDLLEGEGGDDVENVSAQGACLSGRQGPASGEEKVQDDDGAEPIEPPPVPADVIIK